MVNSTESPPGRAPISIGDIWRYTGDEGFPWVKINGQLDQISVGSSTSVWGVAPNDENFRYTGDDSSPWVQIPGALTDTGAGADGTVWGVSSIGEIWRWIGD
ncbi:hypothetical protein MVEN_02560200 [Mycena venus]|uniref:Uncharacterized protein n=1 Tax=Mycena venus TaxID=2733690 RepID=A0A8H6TZ90_9AGAR|nr:hypothetical protein MVEN_02560200 [Mycena venus]